MNPSPSAPAPVAEHGSPDSRAPMPDHWPARTQPWDHQLHAFHFAADKPAAMLAIGMGGGKSLTTVALLEHDLTHKPAGDAFRVLVLCPKSVVGVWPHQLRQHAHSTWRIWSGNVHGARGPLRNPSVSRRAAAIADETVTAAKLRQPLAVIVNYDACWQGDMGRILTGTPWDAVILDESHRVKAAGGKASLFCSALRERTHRRGGRVLALTGTPMPHSPLDLYGQYRALDPNILGTSNARFRARYGARKVKYVDRVTGEPVYLTGPKGQPIYDGIQPDRLPELTERVGRIMFQVGQEELDRRLGLIEPRNVFRTCELGPAARKLYDELERDGIAQIENGTVTASNAMVLVLRLAQATSGFGRDADTGREIALSGTAEKAQLLADILEDLPPREPVVVYCRFHHDLDQVQAVTEASGRRYGELSGRRTDGLTSDSTMADDIDVIGVQIQSGAAGIDLTRARYCVYYTLGFSLGDYEQSRKRVHRPGQTRAVTYLHLLAENTVDRAIYGALRKRQDVVGAFLAHLQKG